ncbi:pyridoxamine 5'-phosphate oxidase family protein [Lentibacillus sp. CBA3610]|uniref:pyridoxamine 5'-phosphate oxidase family protein n=1 Tax=Lentibacillus sp. CBA3610 TaxID=2518176 RepID=UPI0015953809|nr:pyridoxamine 5'-phosphate oxidase family protein [Lentibacillus sp. CBA3610]QKY71372.1 pyridoxamine 5-phosphate oxidase [Lentibacillus sp. CBA3610]
MTEKRGEHRLQEKYETRKRALAFYDNQMLNRLNDVMKDFILEQEMVFISTSDSDGNCDSSFRSGRKGFIKLIDDKTLVYPEYKGNGVMASLGNITENPHIGLMFIDFFEYQIGLHVNGKADILEHDQLRSLELSEERLADIMEEERDKALRWVLIKVDEAYIHCSKHIPKLKKMTTAEQAKKYGDFFQIKRETE